MKTISTSAVCLKNMIVEERRDSYVGDGLGGRSIYYREESDLSDITFHSSESVTSTFLFNDINVADDIKMKGLHSMSMSSLIDNM